MAAMVLLVGCDGPTASSPTPIPIPEPGRPYAADDMLELMAESRRPGGVDDRIEQRVTAAAVAEAVWTFDGRPWATATASGDCGGGLCRLEVAGAAQGAAGDDVYRFEIDASSGLITESDHELRGYPTSFEARIDVVARDVLGARLDGMLLVGARWLPPPDERGRFVASYRSGQEGTSRLEVVIDLLNAEVLDVREPE